MPILYYARPKTWLRAFFNDTGSSFAESAKNAVAAYGLGTLAYLAAGVRNVTELCHKDIFPQIENCLRSDVGLDFQTADHLALGAGVGTLSYRVFGLKGLAIILPTTLILWEGLERVLGNSDFSDVNTKADLVAGLLAGGLVAVVERFKPNISRRLRS